MSFYSEITINNFSIYNGKRILSSSAEHKDCCSFIKGLNPIQNDDTGIKKFVIQYNSEGNNRRFIGELEEWWIKKLKELDIDVDYLGMENNILYVTLNIKQDYCDYFKLLVYTMTRFLWIHYRYILEAAYILEKEYPEVDFWTIFTRVHSIMTFSRYFDNTYSLFYPKVFIILDNKQFTKIFQNHSNCRGGINSYFNSFNKYTQPSIDAFAPGSYEDLINIYKRIF